MLRSMLVGLDGSKFSDAAVELGIRWAKRFDCQLAGIAVVDEPDIRSPQAAPVGGGAFKQELVESGLKQANQKVEQFLSRFSLHCTEAQVSSKVLSEVGLPHEEILRQAQRYDLILMGQQSHYLFQTQEGPCDTLRWVLKDTPRPVVVVPETIDPGDGVLVAFDGSVQASRALQAFLASGLHQLEKIHVLSVDTDSSVEAAKCADRAVEFLGFHDIHAQPLHAVSKHPSEAILEQSRDLGVELLVMGCYGRSKLIEFFLGSTTQSVLKSVRAPLFLHH